MGSTASSSTMPARSTSRSCRSGRASTRSMCPATRTAGSRASSSSNDHATHIRLPRARRCSRLLSRCPRARAGHRAASSFRPRRATKSWCSTRRYAVVKRIATSRRPRDMHFNAAKDAALRRLRRRRRDRRDRRGDARSGRLDPDRPEPRSVRLLARREDHLRLERGGFPARGDRHGDARSPCRTSRPAPSPRACW